MKYETFELFGHIFLTRKYTLVSLVKIYKQMCFFLVHWSGFLTYIKAVSIIKLELGKNLRLCNNWEKHKVDITEDASAQVPIWIFNFWPYWQLRAVRGKIELWIQLVYEQLLNSVFSCFNGQKIIKFCFKYCSIHTKSCLKSLL